MTWYAGVDVGASNVRALVGTPQGDIEGYERRPTPQGPSGIMITEAVLDTLRGACANAGIDPAGLAAVGIAALGPLDMAEGAVRNPANLPNSIEYIPLTGPVEQLINGQTYLHNDANAGAIGERFYADTNPDNMVYLTISSGIGAGVCVEGNVLRGWDGNAGEVGHVTVDDDGELRCGCGKYGHWEAYCSGENIPKYAKYLHEGEPTALPLESDSFSAADVFAADDDDPFADRVLNRVAEYNAQGVATIVHAYAPFVIYVGGGVALNNPDRVLGDLRERLPDRVMTNVPDIELTTFGDNVVVRGAFASAVTGGTGDTSRTAHH